jgi:putative flippase GtrA
MGLESPGGKPRALTRWVLTHSVPRFATVGVLGVVLDVGLLRVFYGAMNIPLLMATALAYLAAAAPIFLLNRHWSFGAGDVGVAHHQLVRYFVALGVNLLSTLAIVGALSALGMYYLIAKLIAIAINAVANFFIYKYWVYT